VKADVHKVLRGAATMSMSHQAMKGNSYQRRARKLWMLRHFGDGTTCNCTHCGCELTYDTVTADRIKPGSQGGTYERDNLQPSCKSCNSSRQDDRPGFVPPLALAAAVA
jgi:5-methylcytosine-specific restriction endonuclease McrA